MFFYIVIAIKYRYYVGFSASGYYKWTTRKISSRESANKELLEAIQKIYHVSKCRYGAPKIHAELKALGKSCNLKTVQSIMQKNDIRAILKRKFKIKKQQTDNRAVAPNILDLNFIVDQPNKVWDYLHQNQGKVSWIFTNCILNAYLARP
ncbi:IS3 family transposase [Wolbachia endosymbiont of Glossina morsitans morsitans]|uniref:IS3 family transposase n=1 Tax=Wolbachia endosymbiont of Glossina morsitans morsitans TaxID=1150948 RepID=UPI0030B83FC1